MAGFTQAELLNEVSRLIGGYLDPKKEAGLTDVSQVHADIMGVATLAFLLNPDSLFYLAKLLANSLTVVAQREAALAEDILVALDDSQNIGADISNTANLYNASTSLLALDAAESVTGRGELNQFSSSLDAFNEQLRTNVVFKDRIANTRNYAQKIIRDDIASLKSLHDSLLDKISSLRELATNFAAIDLPSRASAAIFYNVRLELQALATELDNTTSNATMSRLALLKSSASKAAVAMVANFKDPTGIKYRSPVKPIPTGISHLGRAAGTGIPASVTTTPGPWILPLTDLQLKVSEGSTQTISLSGIRGALMNGKNSESFSVSSANRNLHIMVDPTTYLMSVTTGSTTTANGSLSSGQRLGFKHLGAPVVFTNKAGADVIPRMITAIQAQHSGTISGIVYYTNYAKITMSWGVIPTTFHIGSAFIDGASTPFEIIGIDPDGTTYVDNRGATLNTSGTVYIQGTWTTGVTNITFAPALGTPCSSPDVASIGPTAKSGQLGTGTRTLANVIADLNNSANTIADRPIGSFAYNFVAQLSSENSTKLALMLRSKLNPYMQITNQFLDVGFASPALTVDFNSAHAVLGFQLGALDTDTLLTPDELAAAINAQTSGILAETVETIVATGTLISIAGTVTVSDSSADFVALGVIGGHVLEIRAGSAAGTYRVESATTNVLTLRMTSNFAASEPNIPYVLLDRRVKISTESATLGTSLRIVAAPSTLGLTVGITYGAMDSFEAVDKYGEALSFTGVYAGDFLKITGEDEVEIVEVNDTLLVLATPLGSNVTKKPFIIYGAGSRYYEDLLAALSTFMTSSSLFAKYGFNASLDYLDTVLTPALASGQNFASNLNRARQVIAEFLSFLTSETTRDSEYSVTVPTASMNLVDILSSYTAVRVSALDNVVDGLVDRKYDRAVDLLIGGKFEEFFATNAETASYAGAVFSGSRSVLRDMPPAPGSENGIQTSVDNRITWVEGPDADNEFSDTMGEDWSQ